MSRSKGNQFLNTTSTHARCVTKRQITCKDIRMSEPKMFHCSRALKLCNVRREMSARKETHSKARAGNAAPRRPDSQFIMFLDCARAPDHRAGQMRRPFVPRAKSGWANEKDKSKQVRRHVHGPLSRSSRRCVLKKYEEAPMSRKLRWPSRNNTHVPKWQTQRYVRH